MAEVLSLPQQWREQMWLANGETGISSKTIHAVLTGMVDNAVFNTSPSWFRYDVPHDPSDFRRCYLLLKFIPEWKQRLHEVAERFPKWKPFVEQWDELTRLYEDERDREDGKAPLLYKLMKELKNKGNHEELLRKIHELTIYGDGLRAHHVLFLYASCV